MPCENSWLLENRIARLRLYDSVTPDEIVIASARLRYDFLDKSSYRIHLLITADNLKSAPHNFSAIQDAFQILLKQKNHGWIIVIGLHHPLMRFIALAISRHWHDFKGVATLDAALEFLREVDPDLVFLEADADQGCYFYRISDKRRKSCNKTRSNGVSDCTMT